MVATDIQIGTVPWWAILFLEKVLSLGLDHSTLYFSPPSEYPLYSTHCLKHTSKPTNGQLPNEASHGLEAFQQPEMLRLSKSSKSVLPQWKWVFNHAQAEAGSEEELPRAPAGLWGFTSMGADRKQVR